MLLAVLSLVVSVFAVTSPLLAHHKADHQGDEPPPPPTPLAVVSDHEAHSNEANEASYWGSNCTKPSGVGVNQDSYQLPALPAGTIYDQVIVKAGSGTFANTIFDNPLAGSYVWADTNGDSLYNVGGPNGDSQISHIIICTTVLTADVTVAKDTSVASVAAPGTFNYVFVVTTSGNAPSVNVTLTDPLPNDFSYGLPVITSPDGDDTCSILTESGGTGTLSCSFGTEPSGTTITVTLTATTDADDCGDPITNTATVNATGDTNTTNNTDGASITVTCEEEPDTGEIKVIKRLCTDIGENNVCNGRENEFDGWTLDFEVFEGTDIEADPIGTITVTLDEGNGSQGQATSDFEEDLVAGETYTVCEVPVLHDPDSDATVDLIAVPRPEPTTGGSNQTEHEDGPCIIVELTPGTNVVQFLDLVDEEVAGPEGSITIVKNAIPDDPQDFAFTTTGAGLANFSLDDDNTGTLPNQRNFEDLAPGSYTVTEEVTAGWTLDSVTCSAGGTVDATNARRVNITISGAENVTCTFVNRPTAVVQPLLGSITIVKNALPDDAQDFAFTTTGTGLSSFSLDDDNTSTLSNQQTFSNLVAGTYTVTEAATAGWTLTSLTCSAGGVVDATNPRQANITLAAGANVTCTFVNTIVRSGTLPSTTPVRQQVLTSTGVPNTATSVETAGFPAAALLGLLMVAGAGVLAAANVGSGRRRP